MICIDSELTKRAKYHFFLSFPFHKCFHFLLAMQSQTKIQPRFSPHIHACLKCQPLVIFTPLKTPSKSSLKSNWIIHIPQGNDFNLLNGY